MGLAILGVVLLLYILLAYFAAKTWQVWHVVLLVFLFVFSFLFFFLASATLKVQQRWRTQYVAAMRDIDKEQQNNQRLTRGSLGGEEPGELQLRGDVKQLLVDRGRVWRNLRLADLGDGQVLLDASAWDEAGCRPAGSSEDQQETGGADEAGPADAAAPPAGASPALGLEADAVVFAFKETPIRALPEPLQKLLLSAAPPDGESDGETDANRLLCKVATFYMGEYKVIGDPNANPNAITLAPTMPLSDAQIEQLQDENTTWVLYEVMPIDAHEVFAGLSAEQLGLLIPPGTLDPEQYRALIESYVRDQQPGNDMDPPERKWMTIKFKQPETIDVDVDVAAEDGQQPLPDSQFDPSGRSVVAALNQGGKTDFLKGDEATFDFATAEELIRQGKADPVQPLYYRRLRDYARAFRSISADADELVREMELAQSDLDKLNESISQLQTQITFQTQQRQELAGDLAGLNTERQILDQYAGMVEQKWSQLREDLSRLYRTNRQLVGRMTATR